MKLLEKENKKEAPGLPKQAPPTPLIGRGSEMSDTLISKESEMGEVEHVKRVPSVEDLPDGLSKGSSERVGDQFPDGFPDVPQLTPPKQTATPTASVPGGKAEVLVSSKIGL